MERPGKVVVIVILVFALAIGAAVVYGALRDTGDSGSPEPRSLEVRAGRVHDAAGA